MSAGSDRGRTLHGVRNLLAEARTRRQERARPRVTPWVLGAATLLVTLVAVTWSLRRDPTPHSGDGARLPFGPPSSATLPRPGPEGVPETWSHLTLGMRREEIPVVGLLPPPAGNPETEALYVPDPSHPHNALLVSFFGGRLYRILLSAGEDSGIEAGPLVALAVRMYGRARGYEYVTPRGSHMVTVFARGPRTFKIDSLRQPEGPMLYELALVDVETEAAATLARSRLGR